MAQSIEPVTKAEELLYSVKRIDTVSADGAQGSGTGYVYGFMLNDNILIPTLVTNKHVVKYARFIKVTVHTADLMEGKPPGLDGRLTQLALTQSNTAIVLHPDNEVDLAAILLGNVTNKWHGQNPGKTLFIRALHASSVWTEDQLVSLDAVEPVVMVGCPNSL
jgi:hypothetical protein